MSYSNQHQPPVGVSPPKEGYAKDAYPPPGYPPLGYPPEGYPPPYAPQYAQPPPKQQQRGRGSSCFGSCLTALCDNLCNAWCSGV